MNRILVVTRKEAKELLGSKGTLFLGLGFALFFPILRLLAILKGYSEFGVEDSTVATSLDGSIFFLPAGLGLLITYMCASQIFLLEKRDAVIETLMCAPVNLRQIWLGKVLGITVFAYLLSLFTTLVILVVSNIISGSLLLPTVATLVHVLLVVPTLIAGFAGLIGFVQFRLGMRENRILTFVIFMPFFIVLFSIGIQATITTSWTQVGILFAISLLLLAVTAYLTKRLSKERIITTIP